MNVQNRYEKWYIEQMNRIIKEGQFRGDRTGTGVYSLPFLNYTHDLRESYPLMSSREFIFDQPITEIIWMMSGSSNIQYLKDNGCPFWNFFATDGETKVPRQLTRAQRIQIYADMKGVPYMQALVAFSQETFEAADAILDKHKVPNMQDEIVPAGELGPVYGVQWRNWPNADGTTFDQLTYALNTLREDPNNRRIVVDCWNPSFLPNPKKAPKQNAAEGKMALTPCHFAFGFYTAEIPLYKRIEGILGKVETDELRELYPIRITPEREAKFEQVLAEHNAPKYYLDINFVMRSNDWVLGQPANMNMYSAMLMMFANELNMVPRFVNYTGWDCHVYSNHLDGVAEINRRWETGEHKHATHKVELVNAGAPKGLFNYHKSDFRISNYMPEGKIKFPIAV
uniref:thymidylate synthase n=1 Tax=Pantoea phage Survivor TaxID=3232176 RepID=A0AAU8KXP7_9CAUD